MLWDAAQRPLHKRRPPATGLLARPHSAAPLRRRGRRAGRGGGRRRPRQRPQAAQARLHRRGQQRGRLRAERLPRGAARRREPDQVRLQPERRRQGRARQVVFAGAATASAVRCGRVQSAAAAGPLRAVAAAAGRAAREPRPRRARPFHGHSRAVDSCCSLTGATKRLPQAEGHHTELPGAWRKPAGSMRRARAAGARGAAADGRRRCVRGQQRAQAVAALAHV